MHSFKSTVGGREVAWTFHFPFMFVKRLKAQGIANLLEPEKPLSDAKPHPTVMLLREDLEYFVDVVWECVKEQAEKLGITAEQFGESLDESAFSGCRESFFQEWTDFFQKSGVPEKAAGLRKQLEVLNATAERIAQIQTNDLMGPVDAALKSLASSNSSGS
ncbi:MAG TPA: hypothetical protein VNQ76_02910 [Planctomicrobium sp.]|nr:hypothetical protein [Planctomicrobium sp.]